jgi:HlyD family secretion protein
LASGLDGSSAGPLYHSATVERGDLTTTITASGTLRPLVTVDVGSQLSGQIAELLADFND